MFRLVIFDLDGTLLDTKDAIAKSLNVTFEEIGLGPYDWDRDIVRFFGRPFEEWAETLLKEAGRYSKEEVERVSDRMWENYSTTGVKHAKLMPGAVEVLNSLKKKGTRLAVATNMKSRNVKIFFSEFGLAEYFDKVCTISDVEKGKPHPDQVECILRDLDIGRKEVLMVGDSKSDLDFAKNAEVKLALLDSPWNQSFRPDYRIKKLEELLEIV